MLDNRNLPEYEVPEILTYTDEEILEELGPAQAAYGVKDSIPMPPTIP